MCIDCGCSSSPLAAPKRPAGATRRRTLEEQLLGRNAATAHENRSWLTEKGIHAINLLAGPGAGKTTLLEQTLIRLMAHRPAPQLRVIEGDQQTSLDAERILQTGVPAVQINTEKGCHLNAGMIQTALRALYSDTGQRPLTEEHREKDSGSLLFIENIGNLVCPALWDLGENAKVVLFSVTEGEEKPLKYPDMFAAADLILVSKIDLLPHLRFDLDRALEACRRINPEAPILSLSAITGEGLTAWLDWLLTLPSQAIPRGARLAPGKTGLASARFTQVPLREADLARP